MEDSWERTHLEEMLMCTVCHDIFRDPRQLPCGHSLCGRCLEVMVDHSSDSPPRCPDCRTVFGEDVGVRVQKNYALANIAEDCWENKRRREEQSKVVHCDFCSETRTPALQTCLKCEASMCSTHLHDHLQLPVFTGHPLVTPLSDLQQRRCPQHDDQVLRFYCNVSRRYICSLCSLESKQHSVAMEMSTVLRRQFTDYMDEHLSLLRQQITASSESVRRLRDDITHGKLKLVPVHMYLNSVTVVLLGLWFIVLYYAYNYSVENQTLTEELEKQRSYVQQICSSIADSVATGITKNHMPPEIEDTITDDSAVENKGSEWK